MKKTKGQNQILTYVSLAGLS